MEDGVVGCFWTKLAQEPMFLIFRSYGKKDGWVRKSRTGEGKSIRGREVDPANAHPAAAAAGKPFPITV